MCRILDNKYFLIETVTTAEAFCPGHITGFFVIDKTNSDYRKVGSRGSGFNTSYGVLTKVELKVIDKIKNDLIRTTVVRPDLHYIFQSRPESERNDDFKPTYILIEQLIKMAHSRGKLDPFLKSLSLSTGVCWCGKYLLDIRSEFQLPQSQGFGMSGGGLLSQALALNSALGSPLEISDLHFLAHMTEVRSGTGLGDIPAQIKGGFTIRERPGLDPYGKVHCYQYNNPILLCVVGEPIKTSEIIYDKNMEDKINEAGKNLLDKLLKEKNIKKMTELSRYFAENAGLMKNEIKYICDELDELRVKASMCMLGNSVFAVFENDVSRKEEKYLKSLNILKNRGHVFETSIDTKGAGLTHI